MAFFFQGQVDGFRQLPVYIGVCGGVIVEFHLELTKVAHTLFIDQGHGLFRGDALLFGVQADGRTVSVVSADIDALVAEHLLVANPDVGLNVFNQVAHVQWPVGVGQGAGNKNLALAHSCKASLGCFNRVNRHYTLRGIGLEVGVCKLCRH